MRLNRLDEAYAVITDVMKRPSAVRHPISWELLTQTLHMRGDYTRELREARKGLAEMRRTASDAAVAGLLQYEIRALAALGRMDELQLTLNELRALRPTSDAFASATRELRWHGYPDDALVIGRLAEQWYRDALMRSPDRRVRLALAETLFELQRWDDARAAFEALAAEELPTAFTRERGVARDIIPFAYLGIDDARRGDTAAANASIDRLGAFDGPYRFGEIPYWQARIAAQLGQCERAVDFLRQSLGKGTSVYDRLEAREFERLVTCRAFQTLRVPTG
jgi:tetratricopeptide (TPR) repeat protein